MIIKDIVVSHLIKYNLINCSQHGFVKGRSCLINLLEFYEYIHKSIDHGHSVDIIYLDFQKAFDAVPHKRLLAKLQSHGFCDNIYRWIKNWLYQRKQSVLEIVVQAGRVLLVVSRKDLYWDLYCLLCI